MTVRPQDVIANALFGGTRYRSRVGTTPTDAAPDLPAEVCAELADVVVEALARSGYRIVTERGSSPVRARYAALIGE